MHTSDDAVNEVLEGPGIDHPANRSPLQLQTKLGHFNAANSAADYLVVNSDSSVK
jgi:hypothetical protein